MTRDECLAAISAAFGHVFTEANVGSWDVRVSTSPQREVILTPAFVATNIHGGGITPEELTAQIQSTPSARWLSAEGEKLSLVLRASGE